MTTAALAPAAALAPRALSRALFAHSLPALAAPLPPRAVAQLPALLGLVFAVPVAVVMVLVSSLIGPFIMFAVPFMLLFGFAFGPLHAMVKGDL